MSIGSGRSRLGCRFSRQVTVLVAVAATATTALTGCNSAPSAGGAGDGSGGGGGTTASLSAAPATVQYAPDSPCPKPTSTTSVTLPEIASSAALTWLYIDIDQGIFAKCGLKVDSSQMSAQAQVSTYLAGNTSLRITGGGLPAAIAANHRPLGIYAVTCTKPIFYFLESPSISSPEQLKGKTIAVLSPVDSTYKIALTYLKQVGLKPSEVHFSYVSTNPNIQAALQSGAAQAAVLGAPYAQVAMAHGAKIGFDFTKSSLKIPSQPVVADPAWVTSHQDVALNIMRAILAGIWIAQSKPDIARAALEKHLKLEPSTADGKVMVAASVYLAATLYNPVDQILKPDASIVDLFKSQAPPDIKAKLKNIDMTSFVRPDLGSILLKQGLAQQLQKIYGAPTAGKTMSPTPGN